MDTEHHHRVAFGKALQEARAAAGDPSFSAIERAVMTDLGPYTPVAETIRNYHNGKVSPEKADLVLVKALAKLYGKGEDDFGPVIAERLATMRGLLGAKATKKGSRHPDSGWSPEMLNTDTVATESSRYAHVA